MAEFKLGRIRFVWQGNWATATTYYKDDVVRYGGRTYICQVGHSSAADFYTDLDYSPTKWNLLTDGQEWKGNWSTSTFYKENDIVKYGGLLYAANDSHTSAATATLGLEADQSKWTLYAEGTDWKGAWATSTRYKVNDLVRYGGYTYVCNEYHTSAATASSGLEADQSKWDIFNPGIEYKGAWSTSTRYKINDVVKQGAGLWICTVYHTSNVFASDVSNWSQFVKGFEYENVWSISTAYQPGDIVSYGGNQYIAKTNHTGQTPSTSTANWDLFNEGFNFESDWNSGTSYRIGDVVRLNGYTYLALSDNLASEPPSINWTRLNSGLYWRGEWTNSTNYKAGDVVRFNANAYVCILQHISADDDSTTMGDATRSPETDSTGTYWNLLAIGQETAVLTTPGDLVYYGGAGPTRLPIGREGQILRAGAEYPEWATLGETDHVYYVATHGTDLPAPIWGKTLDKPWATIRYACEQVEKGPRNPNAKRLLEMNRVFIQREVSEWIQWKVANNSAPFTPAFDFDEYKCERDVGWIVDALIYDLGHGGNVKTRGAANSYVGGLSESETETYGSGLSNEDTESVAALNYMVSVVQSVLNQTAPTINYQTLNGDNSSTIVTQWLDPEIDAETGSYDTVVDLVEIITDAITAGDPDDIPPRISPANLIKVATGQYREVLPIIVPEFTCILGDELRSTRVGPASIADRSLDVSDAKYSIGALSRLETVVGQIVTGADVTESSGNTETQDVTWPLADSLRADEARRLVRTMQHNIDFRLNSKIMAFSTDPTGYNVGYLTGYGDARTLIQENRDFIKSEIIAYIAANYPDVQYSKTKCKRDIGYIIDALLYDLTYGGYTQSLNAGLAYFDGPGTSLEIDSSELGATIASYSRLNVILQQIAANTTVTPSANNTAIQWTDTTNLTGGAAATGFISGALTIINNMLLSGSTSARPNITVSSISGTTTLDTGSAHGLAAGDLVVPRTTANGITANTRYYVLSAGLTATQFQMSTSFGGSAGIFTNGAGLSLVFDTEDRPAATNGVSTTTALITAYTTLSAAVNSIVSNMTSFISTNYPTLSYNSSKCERDARIILDAVSYDFMFNSNEQTRNAAYAYLRASASEVYAGQKEATRAAFSYVKTQAKSNVGGDATAQSRIESLMTSLDDIIFSGSIEGSRCATNQRMADYAVLQLERNRDYIVAEIDAYIDSTYSTTVTAVTATTDTLTCSSTSWMQRNAAIRFTGAVFGGITANTTYYIQNVVNSTSFKIATTRNSNTALNISVDASGTMTASLYYNSDLCLRDVNTYIDALKYDIKYPGNYKSLYAARYYANAALGSLEEDMYYLRDATGIRDQTLEGLTGDLLAPNAYGTSRVSAGAYCSLDPGWGPEDYRAWIITRSPYVQGVSTFGYAAVGQKIDGALHNGGNDSIVSNDFTQVISDGIGAWITNNGRAELVSVFSYYAHIGYLAEAGGRIRATNGNNSYGDFGSVAEGVDTTEVPNTAIVDNKFQFVAVVGSGFTDSDEFYQFEYDNAGNDYTEATWTITGGGAQAAVIQDEFRDDGVFEVRLLDLGDDSSGQFGGSGYLSNANTAQGGSSTSLTLAATDGELSTAYVGMRVVLTGGTGVGQYGIIQSYNSGTKLANVVKESTGAAGWDHFIAGTAIGTPDASTTYVVEPRISFTSPEFTSALTTLPSSGTWIDATFGSTFSSHISLSGTYSGTEGSGALFTVIRNGYKYFVTVQTPGINYNRLETITIPGTSLGGLSPTNDLVLTITAVNSTTGAILQVDQDGYGINGRYVAIRTAGGGTTAAASSEDGLTWTARTLPTNSQWLAVAHGVFDDGSSVGKIGRFVAVATGTADAAYSDDGITWTSTTMPISAGWTSVAFGNGRFVAVSSDSTVVAISLDGIAWDVTGTIAAGGFQAVAYGAGKWVAVRSSTTVAASSTDGGLTWTPRTLPAGSTWSSITFGSNKFVAVARSSNSGAYSLDGETWTAMTIGSADGSTVAGYEAVKYGQGLFMASTYSSGAGDYSFVARSEDGINWTIRSVESANPNSFDGWRALTFGTPQRTGYWTLLDYSGDVAVRIRTGATARARAFVAEEKIFSIRIIEPGSGYDALPTMTVTDPNNTFELPFTVRKGKGVLSQPTWTNRGNGYATGSAEIDTGDGYGDFYQFGSFVAVRRLTQSPVPGSNLVLGNISGTTFKLVNVVTFLGTNDGAYTAFLQISPDLSRIESPEHGTSVTTRIRYSQVRLTGHDFLDIGTGNFTETNYPGLPTQDPVPANETVESNGGRVFYTSTDQDGNFRVGDLFTIEQSTGVATLNADAFNISGLQELNLGEVTLGGGSATVTEFSTDPFFTADSDNIVPTQRAIKAYIASQIGGGGASLNVNSVTAGSIKISSNTIENITGASIKMKATFEFRGGVIGLPIAFQYFLT